MYLHTTLALRVNAMTTYQLMYAVVHIDYK